MKKIKVKNMLSNNGNYVPNQFEIYTNKGVYFQSYDTVIAYRDHRSYPYKVVLDKDNWDYSITTGKYRNIFLGENKKETLQKIENGTYKLQNLN